MTGRKLDRQKIENQLIKNGLSIKELTERAGLGTNVISRAINGHTCPRPKTVGKICAALNCSPSDIFTEGLEDGTQGNSH